MTPRDRMQTALRGGTPDRVPVYLCYNSMYVHRHTTLEYFAEYERRMGVSESYPVTAREDLDIRRQAIGQTIELFAGRVDFQFVFPCIPPLQCEVLTKRYVALARQYVDTVDVRIVDDGEGARAEGVTPHGNWARGTRLDSKADVDRYFEPSPSMSPAAQAQGVDPYSDLRDLHRGAVADCFRVAQFTVPFVSAIAAFGYEGAMMAMHDRPDVFRHFIARATEDRLSRIPPTGDIDGFWLDEYYTDVISPQNYEEYVFKPNLAISTALREREVLTMYYLCGDIMPRLHMALALDVDAIAFEESKKGFTLDVADVRRRVGTQKALVGNLDGLHLMPRGTTLEIEAEVRRQLWAAAPNGGFVMGSGSPIAPDTPRENLLALLETTRRFGVYPIKQSAARLRCSDRGCPSPSRASARATH